VLRGFRCSDPPWACTTLLTMARPNPTPAPLRHPRQIWWRLLVVMDFRGPNRRKVENPQARLAAGYTFAPAPPQTATIRIDYRTFNDQISFADYLALFEDSGWRHLAGTRRSGTQYFLRLRADAATDTTNCLLVVPPLMCRRLRWWVCHPRPATSRWLL